MISRQAGSDRMAWRKFITLLVLGTGLAFGVTGCPSGDGLCSAGEEQACFCPGEVDGIETCAADGDSWGACQCPCLPDCADKACGQDGCGGSCGECDSAPEPSCQDQYRLITYDSTGSCRSGDCQYTAHVAPCAFGCADGACNPDPCDQMVCDTPPGPCYQAQGSCVHEPEAHCQYTTLEDGAQCPDELFCNGIETCLGGECQPALNVDCSELDAPCAQGVCDEASDACLAETFSDGTPCPDGLFCNGPETCLAGQCQAGLALDCSHLDSDCAQGDCSEELSSCVTRPINVGQSCSDDLACNGQETCGSRGQCESHDPISCPQPDNQCFESVCTEQTQGCLEQPVADQTSCDDGDPCTLGDQCQAGQCISGNVAQDNTPCQDGDPCTIDETCIAGQCIPGGELCSGMVVFLAYMDADNNLDEYLTADWHEMEAANVDDYPWLRVFVVIDHDGLNDSHFYEVHSGYSTEMDAPNLGLTISGNQELNMADGATVTNFILDGKAIVGEEASYFLMLSDHGDGWRRRASPEQEIPAFRGTCTDDHSPGDLIYTAELQQAVAGQDLLLIGFDACLEGMAEVAYQLRNDALVMVGSQELEPGDGWQFTTLLRQFGQSGDPTPHNFGQIVVDTYMASYAGDPWATDITQAAYDLTKMDALAAAADAVATELSSMSSSAFNSTCNDMDWYGCFWGMCEDYTDLVHLAQRAKARDARANDAIYDTLILAVEDAVIHSDAANDHPNSHGMNVYFPCSGGVDSAYNSTNLFWAADTGWDEMLSATRR